MEYPSRSQRQKPLRDDKIEAKTEMKYEIADGQQKIKSTPSQ